MFPTGMEMYYPAVQTGCHLGNRFFRVRGCQYLPNNISLLRQEIYSNKESYVV